MGFLNKIFRSSEDFNHIKKENKLPWEAFIDKGQIDAIIENSKTRPQIIFKHSIRCGISSMVLNNFEKDFQFQENVDLYFLDLIRYREISNLVAEVFHIWHESPQLLIIKNRKCLVHKSHGAINDTNYASFIN